MQWGRGWLMGWVLLSTLTVDAHTLVLNNRSGAVLPRYPLQVGQAFMLGEIPEVPTFSLNGQVLDTQAEVTQRWGDGSVRYAVMSAVLPPMADNGQRTLRFTSRPAGSAAQASVAALLQQFPDFDASLSFTANGVTQSVSAREMLRAQHVTWEARGPQRYALRVADHTGRRYDLGFDGRHRPLRPTFRLDFWPALNKIRVRATVESPNLDALQDVQYDVALSLGRAAPRTVWHHSAVRHYFGSRWSQVVWVGAAPSERVGIRHDMAHLAQTGLIPNMQVDERQARPAIDDWLAAAKRHGTNLYEPGLLTPYMPTTGHRQELGHMPAWVAAWLKTGDYRLRQLSLQQAELADAWPAFFREHEPRRFFDREHRVAAPGRVMSLNAHPTLWFPDNNGNYAHLIPPRITDQGSGGGWVFDSAHQPNLFAEPYLLTGDPHYLESLQAWAAMDAFMPATGAYGRGKDGYGGFQDQVRGNAWALRNRALAATLSPDGSPEKRYFHQLMDDMLAFWMGQRGIASPNLSTHPNYRWAARSSDYLGTPVAFESSPLHYWSRRAGSYEESSPWQEWFLLAEMGFVRDLGFPIDPLLRSYARVLTGQITSPDFDPRYIAAYRQPMTDANGEWLRSWAAVAQVMQTTFADWGNGAINTFAGQGGDPIYALAAATAGSYLTGYTDGPATWAWLRRNVVNRFTYTSDYLAWHVLPRETAPPVPPRPADL